MTITVKDSDRSFWAYGGDTGDETTPHDWNFNCNGLVLPDLTPHPAMFECLKLFQPVEFSLGGAISPSIDHKRDPMLQIPIRIENRNFFTTTSDLVFTFDVLVDGRTCYSAMLESNSLPVLPLESVTIDASLPESVMHTGTNCLVHVSAALGVDTLYAKAGHLVAWSDIEIEPPIRRESDDRSREAVIEKLNLLGDTQRGLSVCEIGTGLQVQGSNFVVSFDPLRCGIYSFTYGPKNIELFSEDNSADAIKMQPQFWRALTDNDRGGYLALWRRFGLEKACSAPENCTIEWEDYGLSAIKVKCSFALRPSVDHPCKRSTYMTVNGDRATVCQPTSLKVNRAFKINPEFILDHLIEFKKTNTLQEMSFPNTMKRFMRQAAHQYAEALNLNHETVRNPGEKKYVRVWKKRSDDSNLNPVFRCELSFIVESNGAVRTTAIVEPSCLWPCLPRVGMHLELSSDYRYVTWYGKGPHECYPDRQTGARTAIHHSAVADMFFPYIRPSETGSRCNTRWAVLHCDAGINDFNSKRSRPALFVAMQDTSEEAYPFHFSALPYSPMDLELADHVHELPEHPVSTHVNLDYEIMGVGGDDSWSPCIHAEYLVHPKRYEYTMILWPFDPSSCTPDDLYSTV